MSTHLGVTLAAGGADVAVWSEHATQIYFCPEAGERVALVRGEDHVHRAFVPGVKAGLRYGLRAEGPRELLFDSAKLLIDPYAGELSRHADWHPDLARFGADTAHLVPKSIVVDRLQPVQKPKPHCPQFIYEMPVRAFTKLHPDVPENLRGTLGALKTAPVIAHLKRIGCDTIELMPIAAWTDERHLAPHGLRNAWGYNPVSFFAVEPMLAPGGLQEVRDTFAALHMHGFQIILDVVFNHTGESDFGGGTFSLRGLDHASYYRLHNGQLVNDTGCGNTMALDSPPAMQLVLHSMRHWIALGADGFRYDLAPVMGRTQSGFQRDAPLLCAIEADPILCEAIHIAEPWDVGPGGYQLGNFPAAWHEWNDHYRDDVRKYWRGDGTIGALATRLAGSSDIFQTPGRKPSASINFVAAHDGYSLRDSLEYSHKINHANGEDNRDGSSHETSWVADDPHRMVRCLLAGLFLSRGTPMLTAGDEFGRTQGGNNNAYAQDNEVTWLDWKRADEELITFVATLQRFRQTYAGFFSDEFLTPDSAHWFGADGQSIDWKSSQGMALAVGERERLLIVVSRSGEANSFVLPDCGVGKVWQRVGGIADVDAFVRVFVEE